MRIYLIGFMGSGKSFSGKRLAGKLGFLFLDLDQLIEAEAGMDIPEIFRKFGEDHFRQLERQALHFTGDLENVIVSTGGGAPCFFENMNWINRNGISIYLDTPADVLTQRLLPERDHRPLIKPYDEHSLSEFIQSKLKERSYFYQKAKIIYKQEKISGNVVDDLIDLLQKEIS